MMGYPASMKARATRVEQMKRVALFAVVAGTGSNRAVRRRASACRASDHLDRVPGSTPEIGRGPAPARTPHEGAARHVEEPRDERQALGRQR